MSFHSFPFFAAGTGSGSLTHSLARAVVPSGHVYTFDFHALRAQEAAAEFKKHRLERLITVQQRDIEEQGFPQVCSSQLVALLCWGSVCGVGVS